MKKVLMLQLPGTPSFPNDHKQNIPYAAGCLAAHVKTQTNKFRFIIPSIKTIKNIGDDQLIKYILSKKPDYLLFSLYMWNVERSLYIASKIKTSLKRCKIIVGGPEVLPDNEWIFDHNYVDHFVCGEGEAILHKILTNKKTKRVYIEKNKINYLSPYLAKTLPISSGDPVLIEAQRGCPFKCTFCYYPKSKQQISVLSLRDIEAIIRMALRKNVRDIIFIDPTFNNYPDFNKLLNLLIELNKEKRIKYHAEIKPHLLSKEQINLINKAGFESLEVGLQTVNKSTQKTINCFIPLEKFRDNLKLFHKSISLRVDLLAGLPNETLNDIKSGMKYVKKNLPKSDCYLYHVSAIPGTALRRSLNKKNYQHRPPYFVLNNGKIGIKEICKANSFFEKTFDEELDSMPDLNDIYKKRGKYNYFLITPKNISRYKANSISLFNVLEFKSVKFNERFFHQTLQIINRATASNPFCTFYFFISSSCFDRTRVLEGIFSSSKLAYNQYVNNCRICSPEEIANLRVGFINERKNK